MERSKESIEHIEKEKVKWLNLESADSWMTNFVHIRESMEITA
jgi:hypothetical protein